MPEPAGDEARRWAAVAARAAASKTDDDVVVLAVADVLAITSWFVVCSGGNLRQVDAIAEEVEAQVRDDGGPKPLTVEGLDAREWVLLNYGEVVVHVFHRDQREYYDLERLWRDVPRLDWRSALAEG